jgi:hypothetical protein
MAFSCRFMRACEIGISLALATAAFSAPALADQRSAEEELSEQLLKDNGFSESCRDGQPASEGWPVPCDSDGERNGKCSFGGGEGQSISVPVGETRTHVNSCEVVGRFSCTSSNSLPIDDPNRKPAPSAAKRGAANPASNPYSVQRAY